MILTYSFFCSSPYTKHTHIAHSIAHSTQYTENYVHSFRIEKKRDKRIKKGGRKCRGDGALKMKMGLNER